MDDGINFSIITGYMNNNGLSKKEFCKRCKIGVSTFYKIMRGENLNLAVLFRIAKTMNVQVHRLFVGDID